MSVHIDALRDLAANGHPVCDEVADELKDNEQAYALLWAENAKLRKDADRYLWLKRNSGYTIRCNLFGDVGMYEHKDGDLDALIDEANDVERHP